MNIHPAKESFIDAGLPPDGPEAAILTETWAHWDLARGIDLVPDRRALELHGLRNSARHLMLYEVNEDDILVRLSGTALFGFFGAETTGKSLKDLTRPGRWEQRQQRIRTLLNQPCAWWFRIEAHDVKSIVAHLYVLCLPIKNVGSANSHGLLTAWAGWPRGFRLVGEFDESVQFSDVLEFTPFSIGAGVPAVS